jgi:hypothetical protein
MHRTCLLATAIAMPLVAVRATPAERKTYVGDGLPYILLANLHVGTTVEQYVAQLAASLRQADPAGGGLDKGDIAIARARTAARARASTVSEVLSYDLNGDLQVTIEEVQRASPGDASNARRTAERLFDRFDADGDGRITVKEAAAGALPSSDNLDELLAFDPNHDGHLTAVELRDQAERAFGQVDRDGDGGISAEEYAAVAARVRDAQIARSAQACALPPVAAGTRLVAYGSYEADSLSSTAVGGPDQETNLLDVMVEPGQEPLYLVLSSYESMVWRLSGATDRVQRVVVSSFHTDRRAPRSTQGRRTGDVTPAGPDGASGISAAGVVGVAPERVTITGRDCPGYFDSATGSKAIMVRGQLKRSLGREPDALFGSYSAQRASLPSGAVTRAPREGPPAPAGFDPAGWREAVRYWPGGLQTVDPAKIVAQVRVAPYQVLPSQMGLAQLVGSGAATAEGGGVFRIIRPIKHMPPSMGGAHSAKLVFARGVPVPPGDPVHSCIVQEGNTAEVNAPCSARSVPTSTLIVE